VLLTEERASQARRAAAAVDADLAAGESANIESGIAQAGVSVAIFFDRKQAVVAER
jgi:hypothetical protein